MEWAEILNLSSQRNSRRLEVGKPPLVLSNRAHRLHEGRWDELSCRNMTVYQACENNDGITFDDKIEIVGEHGVTM
jgi:hypothetical protein